MRDDASATSPLNYERPFRRSFGRGWARGSSAVMFVKMSAHGNPVQTLPRGLDPAIGELNPVALVELFELDEEGFRTISQDRLWRTRRTAF